MTLSAASLTPNDFSPDSAAPPGTPRHAVTLTTAQPFVSHRAYVRVLSHHQPIGSRTRTAIPADLADQLVQRMAAEQISQGVIRMMPPDSVFLAAVKSALPEVRYIPTKLPPVEVENCKFIRPKTDPRPSVASVRLGWDWSYEEIPASPTSDSAAAVLPTHNFASGALAG